MQNRKLQFEYDLARVMVSLALRQYLWRCEWPLKMTNVSDSMTVWIGNGIPGLHFTIDGRTWGEPKPLSYLLRILSPWRYRLYNRAWMTVNADCVHKYGTFWEVVGAVNDMKKQLEIVRATLRACKDSRVNITCFKHYEFGTRILLLLNKAKNYCSLQRFTGHSGESQRWQFLFRYGRCNIVGPITKLWR